MTAFIFRRNGYLGIFASRGDTGRNRDIDNKVLCKSRQRNAGNRDDIIIAIRGRSLNACKPNKNQPHPFNMRVGLFQL